ncbi:MAG: hypothetical protein K2N94_02985 [Lachnospiraceae bacterium]|nr:hypothetical protein [Lachnospiraceae bacterium]
MNSNTQHFSFRILILITNPKLAKKATKLFGDGAVPMHYNLNALGTAPNEMMDILGLGSIDKNLLVSILPKHFADEMLRKLRKALKIGVPDSGIAFTMPITGANNHIVRMLKQLAGDKETAAEKGEAAERKEETTMAEFKHVMIASIVNQGYSEEVMNAARSAGAGGGSVLHSRRVGSEKAMDFWGLSVQEEKEIILILAKAENKLAIMQAISDACGLRSDAKGIVVSLPIDAVIGLNEV